MELRDLKLTPHTVFLTPWDAKRPVLPTTGPGRNITPAGVTVDHFRTIPITKSMSACVPGLPICQTDIRWTISKVTALAPVINTQPASIARTRSPVKCPIDLLAVGGIQPATSDAPRSVNCLTSKASPSVAVSQLESAPLVPPSSVTTIPLAGPVVDPVPTQPNPLAMLSLKDALFSTWLGSRTGSPPNPHPFTPVGYGGSAGRSSRNDGHSGRPTTTAEHRGAGEGSSHQDRGESLGAPRLINLRCLIEVTSPTSARHWLIHYDAGQTVQILLRKTALEIFPRPLPELGPATNPPTLTHFRQLTQEAIPSLQSWRPEGTLVAFFKDHTAAIKDISLSTSQALFATASDDMKV
ncbi:Serine/threonine-protein kinase [Dimargaris cristalligena]|nr:Serine/threonine-protein kinase [Dimargaris cristalligena]